MDAASDTPTELAWFDQNSLSPFDISRLWRLVMNLFSSLLAEGDAEMNPKWALPKGQEGLVQTCLTESGPKNGN